MADPKIGMTLQGRYQILRKLGDGGMGAVYEGVHTVIKRRVAIKVLHPQFAQNPEIVARFHREAEAATSIGHPNIVEVTDMGSFEDGSAYMVLEFLDGRDWAHDIDTEGPQPLGKVAQILTQCCDALEAAHAKGIVHRDLKPENIFLIARSGNPNFVKVVDFGISKIMDGADGPGHSLTQTGTALGTPYYMAPEQCQGKKDIDHRADIYSLGVIFFQSLTAQYPFDDESYPMLVLKICTEQPPLLSTFRPDLPPQMQGILHRMLAKNRENRFANVGELRAALAPYLGHNVAPVVATNAPSTASHGPSVLHGPPISTPVSSPTGTAYLPSSPGTAPGGTPYPLEVPSSSNKGLILAVVAMLGLIVVFGGVLGTYFALSGGAADEPTSEVGTRSPTPAPADPPDVEVAEPAADPAPTPSEPSVAQAPEEVVRVTITAPEGVTIRIDDEPYGNSFIGDLTPREHRIVATGDGFEDWEDDVNFARRREFTVPIVRTRVARTRPTSRGRSNTLRPRFPSGPVGVGGGARPTPTPTPTATVRPTPTPTPTPRPTPTGDTVGSGTVFD